MKAYEAAMADAHFAWEGTGHVRLASLTAGVYLTTCVVHNRRKQRKKMTNEPSSRLVDLVSIVHNLILVVFSGVVFVGSIHAWLQHVEEVGLHEFLCPSPPTSPASRSLFASLFVNQLPASHQQRAPLSGPLHWWCYVFYLSKYYELLIWSRM